MRKCSTVVVYMTKVFKAVRMHTNCVRLTMYHLVAIPAVYCQKSW